jgi:hypothetical protein
MTLNSGKTVMDAQILKHLRTDVKNSLAVNRRLWAVEKNEKIKKHYERCLANGGHYLAYLNYAIKYAGKDLKKHEKICAIICPDILSSHKNWKKEK